MRDGMTDTGAEFKGLIRQMSIFGFAAVVVTLVAAIGGFNVIALTIMGVALLLASMFGPVFVFKHRLRRSMRPEDGGS
jgi:hypothetical protein